MDTPGRTPRTTHTFEKFLAIANGILCLAACAGVARLAWDYLFPFPGLYLLELAAACGVVIYSVFRDVPPAGVRRDFAGTRRDWGLATWVAAGLYLSFTILGLMSVGILFFLPTLFFVLLGALSDRRQHGKILIHLGVFLLAAVVQAGFMLGVFWGIFFRYTNR